MFESAEIGHAIDKSTYDAEVPALREALLDAQYRLKEQARFPVLILINGIEGAGKGETVKLLSEWMDPRLIRVESFDMRSDEELAHPPSWRYWRKLPPKGRMGVFFGNWYSQMLQDRVHGKIKDKELELALGRAERMERMLCDEGTLIFKLWFHLSKQQMKARLQTLKADPLHSWRISPLDWQQSKTYDKFVRHGEHVLRRSSREYAPWYVIDGSDERYRSLTVGRILLEGMQAALADNSSVAPAPHAAPMEASFEGPNLLDRLDLSQSLSKEAYKQQLIEEQARLSRLFRDPRLRERAVVAVFEGHDAAGKGGAIRRVTGALDPRMYRIVPVSAPSEDERAQPWLWRFWRNVPERGNFTIFDRSWYGRVLVERVEGFCSPADWLRAYDEINDFEEQLVDAGVVLVKFWLSIDPDEQLARFKARETNPLKRFKITEEDWRNREKLGEYSMAVSDMVDRTSTEIAHWTMVEANDKRFARVKVLRTLNEALERAIE
ncbi:polyphosphate:AMP phosphotransferase [Stutzerimonas nosocomialis]|uniref:polyphosphate:AMP phosphotransferase n=1 Tax=Stutzerimonas nosocomialis TaxID=1056496 RepID=UPI0011083532|nr:polyphosphate:AMP phosphotransferase [Stutzerimonas nosocomialis]TLX59502.1 polyphosphate:AMP phosphotransferase [Stutzerimonas nosocomialis]TLX60500.1 polyphosphate:AMP phosphotransferase [Stutzerimonas nosocomialis]